MIPPRVMYTKIVDTLTTGDMGELQDEMLKVFCRDYRKCSYEEFKKFKPFFVINNFFLLDQVDESISSPYYDLYFGDKCKFKGRLVIPIYGFDGLVHGFVGYDKPDEDSPDDHVKYLYSSEIIFQKERYMLMDFKDYEESVYQKDYVYIVEGFFDMLALKSAGINAVCINGSRFSKYLNIYLSGIKNWVIPSDNDSAGNKLFMYLKTQKKNNLVRLRVKNAKDIDEYIAKNGVDNILKAHKYLEKTGFLIDVVI